MLGCRPLLSGVGWWSNPCRPCKCPATKLCFLLLLSQKETGRETPRGIACGPPLGTSKEPIVPASLSGSWRPNAAEGSSCPQFQSVFTSNMANLREETLSLSKFSLLLSDLKYKGFYLFLLLHSGCRCLPSQTMQGRPSRGTPVEGRGEQDVVAPSVMGDEGLTQAGAPVSPWLVSDTCCSLSVWGCSWVESE